jgi:hypothetical protein
MLRGEMVAPNLLWILFNSRGLVHHGGSVASSIRYRYVCVELRVLGSERFLFRRQ